MSGQADYLKKERMKVSIHKYLKDFNPDVELLDISQHQDYLNCFDAGKEYPTFSEFICEEAVRDVNNGDGVTYLIFDHIFDDNGNLVERKLISYYTLETTAIPFIDRIRLDEEERLLTGKEFDEALCGIPAVQLKMFAISTEYQDIFYKYEDGDKPVSAWILEYIINFVNHLLTHVIGTKAIFLHAVDENAERFYLKNHFAYVAENMKPLQSVDSDLAAMYMPLKEVHMNYDE